MLYDRREAREEISGTDLHNVFAAVCGDPSPPGYTPISAEALRAYAALQIDACNDHVMLGSAGGVSVIDIANFCDSICNEAAQ